MRRDSLSRGERVGVRGYNLSIVRNPSPGSLRDPTSPGSRWRAQRAASANTVIKVPRRTLAPLGGAAAGEVKTTTPQRERRLQPMAEPQIRFDDGAAYER